MPSEAGKKKSGGGSRPGKPEPGYRILAVDPGTRSVGFAVLELTQNLRPEVVVHGAPRITGKSSVSERLKEIYLALSKLIERTRPAVVVVEEVFYGKNFQSALRIGEGRGVVLLAAALAGLDVVEYAPATVKQAVSGNGQASKIQVQRVVTRLLDLQGLPESSDAADALAIAFCHAQRICGSYSASGRKLPRSSRRRKDPMKSLQSLLNRLNR